MRNNPHIFTMRFTFGAMRSYTIWYLKSLCQKCRTLGTRLSLRLTERKPGGVFFTLSYFLEQMGFRPDFQLLEAHATIAKRFATMNIWFMSYLRKPKKRSDL